MPSSFITPTNAESFAYGVVTNQLPWLVDDHKWSDSTKEQYFNLLNADVANQHELAMWRLNNDYNTPVKQMERMIEAGINPAAAYQQVNSGNSGSAPGVHEAKSANWHDTRDKLDKINTIMNGISSIIGSVGSAVGAASGIQDMALTHQNNWYGQMRNQLAKELLSSVPAIYNEPKGSSTYELYPGAYIDQRIPMFFPELVKGFNTRSYEYDLKSLLNDRQQGMYDKQMQVNDILNSLFSELDSKKPDIHSLLNNVLKLISIQLLRRY